MTSRLLSDAKTGEFEAKRRKLMVRYLQNAHIDNSTGKANTLDPLRIHYGDVV